MADSLIAHNYFYEDFYGNYEDYFAGKYFKFPGMNEEIYIKGIILQIRNIIIIFIGTKCWIACLMENKYS